MHTWSSEGVQSLTSPIPEGAKSRRLLGLSVPWAKVPGRAWEGCRAIKVTCSIDSTGAIPKVNQESRQTFDNKILLPNRVPEKGRGGWKCVQLCTCMSRRS